MLSYSYGKQKERIPEEVLKIFSDCREVSEISEYAYEIIDKGIEGVLNLDNKFQTKAYENKVKDNKRLTQKKHWKKNLQIVEDTGEKEETKLSYAVSSNTLAQDMEEAFEKVRLSADIQRALKELDSKSKDIMSYYGVDIVESVKGAISGVEECIEDLRRVCAEYTPIKDAVEVLILTDYYSM